MEGAIGNFRSSTTIRGDDVKIRGLFYCKERFKCKMGGKVLNSTKEVMPFFFFFSSLVSGGAILVFEMGCWTFACIQVASPCQQCNGQKKD